MADPAQGHSSVGGLFSTGRNSSLGRFLPPHNITTYLPDYKTYFDKARFSKLSSTGSALSFPFGTAVRDTAAGLWRRRWKHWCDRVALRLQVACQNMDSPFVRCREEGGFQKSLPASLAEVRRCSEVPNVVAVDLLALPENLDPLYFLSH